MVEVFHSQGSQKKKKSSQKKRTHEYLSRESCSRCSLMVETFHSQGEKKKFSKKENEYLKSHEHHLWSEVLVASDSSKVVWSSSAFGEGGKPPLVHVQSTFTTEATATTWVRAVCCTVLYNNVGCLLVEPGLIACLHDLTHAPKWQLEFSCYLSESKRFIFFLLCMECWWWSINYKKCLPSCSFYTTTAFYIKITPHPETGWLFYIVTVIFTYKWFLFPEICFIYWNYWYNWAVEHIMYLTKCLGSMV